MDIGACIVLLMEEASFFHSKKICFSCIALLLSAITRRRHYSSYIFDGKEIKKKRKKKKGLDIIHNLEVDSIYEINILKQKKKQEILRKNTRRRKALVIHSIFFVNPFRSLDNNFLIHYRLCFCHDLIIRSEVPYNFLLIDYLMLVEIILVHTNFRSIHHVKIQLVFQDPFSKRYSMNKNKNTMYRSILCVKLSNNI